ncbi:MAG TPA: tRNA pseudouridine(55) synthase TruB [Verrucomicrobiae bacterium]|nr:tRNA pseudouridine(55) synthase TruB [Verrucomicrobiae bacterium]
MQPQLSPFDGVLLVDKPSGMTSHDVVDRVRRQFGFHKVGHCGTLDPAATGLLILVIERATKLQDRLMSDDKAYEGTMWLGVSTDSQDADGDVIAEKPVPPLTQDDVDEAFAKFRGDIQQVPPMVSAVKHQGTPLYKLARKGKTVEREPRLVHIFDLRVLGLDLPRVQFRVACTKGTYVRTLCSEIGDLIGCGAHLHELRRTRSGNFDLRDAHSLEEILKQSREQLKAFIIPILKLVGSHAA